MKKWQKSLTQAGLVLLILAAAFGIAKGLSSLRKSPEKKDKIISAPLLNCMTVSPQTMTMNVRGDGQVVARMQVQVVPQVSGKVIACHEQLVDGGFFKANEPLVQIERTDYELAVESAAATVAQARVKLTQEQAEADVARQEWDRLHPNEEPSSVLVLRTPQIQNAKAQLKAAEAQLAKAKLDLERTSITMPFDGRIVSTNIDLGQFITAGTPIATVYRTDLVEVTVPLENSELAWFDAPLFGDKKQAPTPVKVTTTFAGKEHTWDGRLVRTEGEIDPRSRMVHVVAQVDDPFKVNGDRPPLVPGTFVQVEIAGRTVENVYRVPRYAIRNGGKAWVAHEIVEETLIDPNNIPDPNVDADIETESNEMSDMETEQEADSEEASDLKNIQAQETEDQPQVKLYELCIQPVTIVRMDRQSAYISKGLADRDILVLSPLETVTDGMTIRIDMDQEDDDIPAQEDTL